MYSYVGIDKGLPEAGGRQRSDAIRPRTGPQATLRRCTYIWTPPVNVSPNLAWSSVDGVADSRLLKVAGPRTVWHLDPPTCECQPKRLGVAVKRAPF